jgi:predicted nucleic-acid-binding protein
MLKVLIDTSFLLPALGVEVEKEVTEAIKNFQNAEVFYLEESLLEAMWKVLRVVAPEELKIVEEGLNAIRNTYKVLLPRSSSYARAYTLYRKGHRDLIDNLLYAVSIDEKIFFLTIDRTFIRFLKLAKEDTSLILTPLEFVKRTSKLQ